MKLYKPIISLFLLLVISGCVSNSASKGALVGAIYGVAKGDDIIKPFATANS